MQHGPSDLPYFFWLPVVSHLRHPAEISDVGGACHVGEQQTDSNQMQSSIGSVHQELFGLNIAIRHHHMSP